MEDGTIDEGTGPFRSPLFCHAGRRACIEWVVLADGRALPRREMPGAGGMDLIVLEEIDDASAAPLPPGLARLIRQEGAGIAAPVRFREVPAGNPDAAGWSGLLLPFADAAGRVVALQVVIERHAVPSAEERRRLAAELAATRGTMEAERRPGPGAPDPPANPWQRSPTPPRPATSADDRLADARAWAALAHASPACRAQALSRVTAAAATGGGDMERAELADLAARLADPRPPGADQPTRAPDMSGACAAIPASAPAPQTGWNEPPAELELLPLALARLRRRPGAGSGAALAA